MHFHWQKQVEEPTTLVDFIAADGTISKTSAKKALAFGGGWVKTKGTRKLKRVRRATAKLNSGDTVAFYYDDNLIKTVPPAAHPISQTTNWGIWYKPANVPAQGTLYGDIGCMEQQVKTLSKKSSVFLVHRLDKEAAGLMVFAYTKAAAAGLSQLWTEGKVQKFYQANALGVIEPSAGDITLPLDGKPSHTTYKVTTTTNSKSQVAIEIKTGRYHQIRRHFEALGYPLMGDPKYGNGNKNKTGLELVATRLVFICPISKQAIDCTLPDPLQLKLRDD